MTIYDQEMPQSHTADNTSFKAYFICCVEASMRRKLQLYHAFCPYFLAYCDLTIIHNLNKVHIPILPPPLQPQFWTNFRCYPAVSCVLLSISRFLSFSGLGNLGNTRSKLSLKLATTLEIGRLANRGSYPTTVWQF